MNKNWLLSVVFLSGLLCNTTLATTSLDKLIEEQTATSQQLQECLDRPTATSVDIQALTLKNQTLTDLIKKEALAQDATQIPAQQPNTEPTVPEKQAVPIPPLTEFEKQKKTVRQCISDLFNGFIPTLLNEKDKVILDEQRLLFTALEKSLPQIATNDQTVPYSETKAAQCVNLLIFLCTLFKEVQVKTEFLTTNILTKPLTPQQVVHLQIKMLQTLGNSLRRAWHCQLQDQAFETIKEKYFSHNKITNALLSFLPEELCEKAEAEGLIPLALTLGLIKVYHAQKRESKVTNLIQDTLKPSLTCDMYQIDPTLFDRYLNLTRQYRTGSYAQPNKELKKFLIEIETLAEACENKRQEIELNLAQETQPETPAEIVTHRQEQKILAAFTNKLLTIKNELTGLHPEVSDATKTGIWLRYMVIVTNPLIKDLITKAPEIADFFNEVQKSITTLISEEIFSPQATCELLFTTNKLQKYLKYHEKSSTAKIIFNPEAAYLLVSEMASLLENINAYLLRTTQDPFIKEILTFAFIEPQSSAEEPMGPGKKILVEAAQQITGKKFNNVRDVFLHVMGYVSPWAAATVLSWAMPYLADEVKQPIVSFFAQQQNGQQPVTKESLIKFVAQNPSILPALEKLGPELATKALDAEQTQQTSINSVQTTSTL